MGQQYRFYICVATCMSGRLLLGLPLYNIVTGFLWFEKNQQCGGGGRNVRQAFKNLCLIVKYSVVNWRYQMKWFREVNKLFSCFFVLLRAFLISLYFARFSVVAAFYSALSRWCYSLFFFPSPCSLCYLLHYLSSWRSRRNIAQHLLPDADQSCTTNSSPGLRKLTLSVERKLFIH